MGQIASGPYFGGHYLKSTNIFSVQNFGASSQYQVFTVRIVLAQSQLIWLLCSTPKFQIVTNCPNLTPLKTNVTHRTPTDASYMLTKSLGLTHMESYSLVSEWLLVKNTLLTLP